VIGSAIKRAVQKQIERELKEYPKERRKYFRPVAFILDDAGSYLRTKFQRVSCLSWTLFP